MASTSACKNLGSLAVGQLGSSAMMSHHMTGPFGKVMVLRVTETSLCPNTGAMGHLLVNGELAASGRLTDPHSSLQTESSPGDHVIATLHTFPLFNSIMCAQLGEIKVSFEECDLVLQPGSAGGTILTDPVKCDRWNAWINRLPPAPDELHIVGMIDVPNPGVDVSLVEHVPQGVNQEDLLVELILEQKPGIWPQRIVTKQVTYQRILFGERFKNVIVLGSPDQISIPVVIVS